MGRVGGGALGSTAGAGRFVCVCVCVGLVPVSMAMASLLAVLVSF